MNKELKERIDAYIDYWIQEDKLEGIKLDFCDYGDIKYVKEHFILSPDFSKQEIEHYDNVEYFLKEFKEEYNKMLNISLHEVCDISMFDRKIKVMVENVGSYLYASWDGYSYIIKENDNEEPENFIMYISKERLPPHDVIYFDEIDEIENRISFIKDEFDLYDENDEIIL